jgi:hypothetical protein
MFLPNSIFPLCAPAAYSAALAPRFLCSLVCLYCRLHILSICSIRQAEAVRPVLRPGDKATKKL